MATSSRSLAKLESIAQRAQATVKRHKEKADEYGALLVDAGVGGLTSVILGMLDGYDDSEEGGMSLFGIPITLVAAGGGHGLGIFTGNRVFHAAGNGGLFSFAYTWGRGAGAEFRAKNDNGGSTVQSGGERDIGGGDSRGNRVSAAFRPDGRSRDRATRRARTV